MSNNPGILFGSDPSGGSNNESYSTTVTAAGTTTLTSASNFQQYFTGTTTQTVVLPSATTLVLGQQFSISNRSTGIVTVNKNGGSLVIALPGGSSCLFTVTNIGSGAGTWDTIYTPNSNGTASLPFYASSQVTTASSTVSSTSFSTFSNSPALTFTPSITGTYKVYASIPLSNNSTSSDFAVGRIFNTSGSAVLLYESQAVSYASAVAVTTTTSISVYVESIYTLTAGTSYVFDIQGKCPNGVGTCALEGNSASSQFGSPFYVFAEGLVSQSTSSSSSATSNYWSGYMPTATSWSWTSATFVDPTPSGSNTLTQRKGSGITVTAAASNLPGITFTPAASNAVYMITAQFPATATSAGSANNYQLTDGTTVIVQNLSENASLGTVYHPVTLTGIYVPGTSSSVTVKIQAAVSSGTGQILNPVALGSTIEWSLVRLV